MRNPLFVGLLERNYQILSQEVQLLRAQPPLLQQVLQRGPAALFGGQEHLIRLFIEVVRVEPHDVGLLQPVPVVELGL